MTCFGGWGRGGLGVFADMLAEALWLLAAAFRLLFPQCSMEGEGARRARASLPRPGQQLSPPLFGCSRPRPLPPCQTDSLLAVIYGRAWHKAHRLENFQFTQEFPEK